MYKYVILVALVLACSARADNEYPVQGMTPPTENEDTRISIPGAPLPPIPKASVRDAIRIYSGILAVIRPVTTARAMARGKGFLATLHAAVGEYASAELLFGEAFSLLEKKGIKAGLDLGWVHNNRGLVQLYQERQAEAAQSFHAGLAALNGRDLSEPRAKVLQNLAMTYHLMGDIEKAEDAYLGAIAQLRALGQERGRAADVVRANLAVLYGSMRDYAQARAILQDLADRSASGSMLHFAVLNNLGYTLYALKDFRNAEIRLEQALAFTAAGSKERVLVLTNLAAAHASAGHYADAERYGQDALRIARKLYKKNSRSAAAIMGSLGTVALIRGDLQYAGIRLSQAAGILSATDKDQQVLAAILQELALVAQRQGLRDRAIELSRQALDLEKKNLARILAFGSEAQRLAYRSNAWPYDQLGNLGEPKLLADAVLATKGAVLASLLAERSQIRRAKSPADQQRLNRVHALRVKLMNATARGDTHRVALERDLKQEETALARSVRSVAPHVGPMDVSLAKVQAALDPDQVLVEIIRYQRYEAAGKQVPWYGAVIIPRQGNPKWTPIAASDAVDELIGNLTTRLDVAPPLDVSVRAMDAFGAPRSVLQTLRELHTRLWKPLAKSFPANTKGVLLSPDGATHFIPWAALLDENERFLVERWRLAQVGSGRDLLRKTSPTKDQTLLIFADALKNLPGSRREAEHVARIARQQGWQATTFFGDEAKESLLSRYPAPRVLLFATHGGQLGPGHAPAVETRLSRNPMYRGALLLSGGGRTLDQWANNMVVPFSDDGILTAEEVAGLRLDRTWLTVLSACRSGTGDARIGEGVLGLRRGFALAGTENLLFTLWSVQDDATAQFMEAFLERLFRSKDLSLAFHETQVAELQRWKRTLGVEEAVSRAGAFVLTR